MKCLKLKKATTLVLLCIGLFLPTFSYAKENSSENGLIKKIVKGSFNGMKVASIKIFKNESEIPYNLLFDRERMSSIRPDSEIYYYRKFVNDGKDHSFQGIPLEKRLYKTVIPDSDLLHVKDHILRNAISKFVHGYEQTNVDSMRSVRKRLKTYIKNRKKCVDYNSSQTLHPLDENTPVFSTSEKESHKKLEKWYLKQSKKMVKIETKINDKLERRKNLKRGKRTFLDTISKIAKVSKLIGNSIKTQTIRGRTYIANDLLFGLSLYEVRPFYGKREGGYIAVRIGQFTTLLTFKAIAYGISPATEGVSIIVDDLGTSVLTTVIGETITNKLKGQTVGKMTAFAIERTAEKEVMNALASYGGVPALKYGEEGVEALGNVFLVFGYFVDYLSRISSSNYVSYVYKRNLGRPEILSMYRDRLDYLVRLMSILKYRMLQNEGNFFIKNLRKYQYMQLDSIRVKLEKLYLKDFYFYYKVWKEGRLYEDDAFIEMFDKEVRKAIMNPRKNLHQVIESNVKKYLETSF